MSYSENQNWQKSNYQSLNLIKNHYLPFYRGALELSNNSLDDGSDPVWLKLDFSQPVNLSDLWVGGLGIEDSTRDWVQITAYDSEGEQINPSEVGNYQIYYQQICQQFKLSEVGEADCSVLGSDSPKYTAIQQKDKTLILRGQGESFQNQEGRVFLSYQNLTSLEFKYLTTKKEDPNSRSNQKASIVISPQFNLSAIAPDINNSFKYQGSL